MSEVNLRFKTYKCEWVREWNLQLKLFHRFDVVHSVHCECSIEIVSFDELVYFGVEIETRIVKVSQIVSLKKNKTERFKLFN